MKKLLAAGKPLAVAIAACASMSAHAQSAGDNVVGLGWFHVMPQDSSNELTTHVAPTPINTPLRLPSQFTSAGTSLSTKSADTFGLVFTHFFTDHIATTFVNLDQTNPIVKSVRQWSPALIFQYYFNSPTAAFRPFAGLGVSYNFFTNIKLTNGFVTSTQNNLGAVLAAGAGKPGQTSVEAKASSSWQPVFNIGATYTFDKPWGLIASLTYIPLKTTSSLIIKAADGTELATTKSKLNADPLITFLAVSYRF